MNRKGAKGKECKAKETLHHSLRTFFAPSRLCDEKVFYLQNLIFIKERLMGFKVILTRIG